MVVGEKLSGAVVTDNPALMEDNGAAAQSADEREIVGDQHLGHGQVLKHLQQQLLAARVQAGRRLVKDQHLGLQAQGAAMAKRLRSPPLMCSGTRWS
jgi:hypothetical protein